YEWSFDLRSQGESGNKESLTIHGSGKFSLQCERIVGPTMANPNHPNPTLDKLATGKLELEVTPEPPEIGDAKPDAPRELLVNGTVVDEAGKPIDGAMVTIMRKAYSKDSDQPKIEE